MLGGRVVPFLRGGGADAEERQQNKPHPHDGGNIVRQLALAALLAVGCGGPQNVPPGVSPRDAAPPPPAAAGSSEAFILESGGTSPDDTVVVIPPRRGRIILVRRGAPDNSLFARIAIPPDSARTDSIRITVRPRPGLYGIDLESTGPLPAGMSLTVSYAIHFIAPAGARDRYGSDLGFERALYLAQATADGRIVFLLTSRPGSDLVAATIPGPGRYVVSAPKAPQ
ncbi:MAG: hypothetical protein EXR94_01455 [Gemmatimonadetes bacterium]|nr:hypothetical protein [Gemmatimonadota bacterium]